MAGVRIRPFEPADAAAVAALCRAEGWESWDDPRRVERALRAPGVTALVAERGAELLGAVQVIGDGEINWTLTTLVVAAGARGRGIGSELVAEAFARTGARRLDLLTEDEGPRFYRRLRHRELAGFRLYPGARAQQPSGERPAP
jgi:ribosomal protein S18 acetylase RimI-like enzyme